MELRLDQSTNQQINLPRYDKVSKCLNVEEEIENEE